MADLRFLFSDSVVPAELGIVDFVLPQRTDDTAVNHEIRSPARCYTIATSFPNLVRQPEADG